MQKIELTCDWCSTSLDFNPRDEEEPKWIVVSEFDVNDEYIELDFCDRDCLTSFFNG